MRLLLTPTEASSPDTFSRPPSPRRRRSVPGCRTKSILGAGQGQELGNGPDGAVEPGRAARVGRVGPAIGHVDDDQRRLDAEAESPLKDAALLVIGVDLGHGGTQGIESLHGLLLRFL